MASNTITWNQADDKFLPGLCSLLECLHGEPLTVDSWNLASRKDKATKLSAVLHESVIKPNLIFSSEHLRPAGIRRVGCQVVASDGSPFGNALLVR